MKKTFFFLAFCLSILNFAQTCITGNTTIILGQTNTFSSVNLAQCNQCYDWDINDNSTSSDNGTVGNIQIVGSDMNQTVSIKGLAIGPFKLCLNYITETGCNSCCITGNVVPPPANCCSPDIDGWFECQNNNTGGQIEILNNYLNGCTVDWSKISSVNIQLVGATFMAPYSGTSYTKNSPTGPFSMSVYSPGCSYQKTFRAIVTFNYNNGCASVQKIGDYYDQGTPAARKLSPNNLDKIKVTPNPATNFIKFNGEKLSSLTVEIYDVNGKLVLNKANIKGDVSIGKLKKGIYFYKIYENKKVIQEGKVLKN